ncbi:hypothetical protein CYY_001735 [Polysphondylium violaceum]|uniref:EGF-like domain-containing protein n=1 Tax=Polysphondylium violaceum TaxID=133409 RepID=A0A8J4Q2R8_9MYCE|nr:hypothetical protein CYY_001735 [Polysphondylium violaceum]
MNRYRSISIVLLSLFLLYHHTIGILGLDLEVEDVTSRFLVGSNDEYSEIAGQPYCSVQYYFKIKNNVPESKYVDISTNSFSSTKASFGSKTLVTVFYHITRGTSGSIDVIVNTNISSFTFPALVSYNCLDTPFPVDPVYNADLYPHQSIDGTYSLLSKYKNYVKYSPVLTTVDQNVPLIAQMLYLNYPLFKINLNINPILSFSTKDINMQNTTISINNFLNSNLGIDSLSTQNNNYYPYNCENFNYFHCYQMFDIVTNSPNYFLGVYSDMADLSTRYLLPIFGNPLNATYFGFLTNDKQFTIVKWNGAQADFDILFPVMSFYRDDQPILNWPNNGLPQIGTLPTPSYHFQLLSPYLSTWVRVTLYTSDFQGQVHRAPAPYGFYSGNLTQGILYNFDVPIYDGQSEIFFTLVNTDDFYYNKRDGSLVATPLIPDTIYPVLKYARFVDLGNGMVSLQIHATDIGSGVSCFVFRDQDILMDTRHLKEGTIFDGVFEIILPKSYWTQQPLQLSLFVLDFAANREDYDSDKILNENMESFPRNPYAFITTYRLIDNIIDIAFEKNDVDLSQSAVNNSLVVKLNPPLPHTTLSLIPCFKLHFTNDFLTGGVPYLDKDTEFNSYFDIETQSHIINFTLPSRLFTGVFSYKLLPFDLDNTILYQLNPKAELRYFSENADVFPPIVTSIVQYPSPIATIGQDTTIGFEITIEDKINGFKSGYAIVTSELDILGYNFTLTSSIDNPNNVFQLYFPLDVKSRPQTFTISKMYLEDNNGHFSFFPSIQDINPLMNFLGDTETSTLSTQFIDPLTLNDTTVPVLNTFTIISNTTDESQEFFIRTLIFEYEIYDDDSGVSTIHLPKLFLTNAQFEFAESNSTIVKSRSPDGKTIVFQTTINYSLYFAFNHNPLISLHGIYDNHMNLVGFSSKDLNSKSFVYCVERITSIPLPVINEIQVENNALILNGFRLGASNSLNTKLDILDPVSNVKVSSTATFIHQNSNQIKIDLNLIPINSTMNLQLSILNILSNRIYFDNTPQDSSSDSSPTSTTSSSSDETNSNSFEIKKVCTTDKDCNGIDNGKCINNACICKYPAFGVNCFDKVVPDSKNDFNTTQPSTSITVNNDQLNLKALVSIVKIIEYDFKKQSVFEFIFNKWEYNQTTKSNGNQLHHYKTNITKDTRDSLISVDIESFVQGENITFAKQELEMVPNSNKYSIHLANYPFSKSTNYLQLIMSVSLGIDVQDSCSHKESGDIVTNSYSEYFKIQVNDNSLYGRFIKRGIIDGKVTVVSNEITNNADSQDTSNLVGSFIGMNIPFFQKTAILDPDFSLLISTPVTNNQENSICSPKKNKLSAAKIAGIVIGSVGFATIVVVSTIYYFQKKKQSLQLQKSLSLRNIS